MTCFHVLRRRLQKTLLLIFFILSTSSCFSPPNFWVLTQTHTGCPKYESSRIYLPQRCSFDKMSVELISSQEELRIYINLLSNPLAYCEKTVSVRYNIGCLMGEVTAFVMDGGQRILIPCELRELIIDSLLKGIPVQLTINNYSFEIPSSNFSTLYNLIE